MKALIQRVANAKVTTHDELLGSIGSGLLVLLGIEPNDDEQTVDRMLDKILSYRVFPDPDGKMNLSLKDLSHELLVVPQFTLAADTKKGSRPSFSSCANPELGRTLCESFVKKAQKMHGKVEYGRFGCDMQVSLINDGPVTFNLSVN